MADKNAAAKIGTAIPDRIPLRHQIPDVAGKLFSFPAQFYSEYFLCLR